MKRIFATSVLILYSFFENAQNNESITIGKKRI